MKKINFFKKTITGLLVFLVASIAQAATPLWTITPLTDTIVEIPDGGSKTVAYQVTNKSRKTHTLSMTPIPGVTQVTSARNCGSTFTLSYQESCTLTLIVSDSAFAGPIGPNVCSQGNKLQCYTAGFGSELTVIRGGHTVGGNVTGLTGTVVLRNNGTNPTTISSDGTFTFSKPIAEGSTYDVTVFSQPSGQTCSVANGSGTMGSSNVTNVIVTCSADSYTVGGSVTGLSGSVTLQNNGANSTIVTSDGSFTFSSPIAEGSTYAVTVSSQPSGQTCSVANGSGTMGSSNVTNVTVTCATNSYTVGGSVSGLSGSVTLQNNGANSTIVTSDGSFTFSTTIAEGSTYAVTVSSQPSGQTCTVTNGTGTMGSSDVTNVAVSCVDVTPTTLSVPTTGIIPVNDGTVNFVVTNTGSAIATGVSATLPGGWTGVTQVSSDCDSIAVGGSCNLVLSSTKPYVAQGSITITGDNITSPPTTAFAFSMSDYLVFAVPTASTAIVVPTSDTTGSPKEWDSSGNCLNSTTGCTQTNASSIYLGSYLNSLGNTYMIISGASAIGTQAATGGNAAALCYNITSDNSGSGLTQGTWFLPAICQIGTYDSSLTGHNAGCNSNIANIETNLFDLGFLSNLTSTVTYWSSTEESSYESFYQYFSAPIGNSQDYVTKDVSAGVRCVRIFNY
ncbi:MAG: hypothetical protein P1U74_07110 [Legionellaceae bacterium]|nr:hypothetical protein [Legionellaceae bacterium]